MIARGGRFRLEIQYCTYQKGARKRKVYSEGNPEIYWHKNLFLVQKGWLSRVLHNGFHGRMKSYFSRLMSAPEHFLPLQPMISPINVLTFPPPEGGSYGNKILYKNLDLTQDFPNKISFHFLWVKTLTKNLPKIFRWPEMCPLGKILAQDF